MKYILLIFLVVLTWCTSVTSTETSEKTWTSGIAYKKNLDPDVIVSLAKKRKSYMVGIRKGDFYSLRNAPEEALSYYLSVHEKLPDDQIVSKKIAHVYFLLKNWTQSYQTYVTVPIGEMTEDEQSEFFSALFFDESRTDRLSELERIPTSTGSKDYYKLVDACYTWAHNCVTLIQSYSGSEVRIQDLQSQIKKAEKVSTDTSYRNFLLAAKFYEQGMFRVSEKLTREILIDRPDYNEVVKMLGFSLYELGNYEESKKFLLKYLEKNPTDLETIVRMGEVHFSLGDYVSSNLYINNAILAWYTPKTNLERRLAYNYSLLGDTPGMIKVLNYLLQETDATQDDYAVAISAALAQWDNERARNWAAQWLGLYKNSNMLKPLYIEALRLTGDRDSASSIIQNTTEEDMVKNPHYILEKAILLFDSGNITEAKKVFTTILSLEWWEDVNTEAKAYVDRIDMMMTQSWSSWW